MPALHIRLLGDFCVGTDESFLLTFTTPRLQSLFAYLLIHRTAPQLRRQIAFSLWPESSDGQAHSNLRNLVYLLRRSLPDPDRFLCAGVQTLQWRPDAPFTLDVADFEQAIAQGALQQAVACYQGELLPGCYDDWILAERERSRGCKRTILKAPATRSRRTTSTLDCRKRLSATTAGRRRSRAGPFATHFPLAQNPIMVYYAHAEYDGGALILGRRSQRWRNQSFSQ